MSTPVDTRQTPGTDVSRGKPSLPSLHVATSEMPQLQATFVPGGGDDYYMPEVYAPSPQRVMPEVPQNMQDGLQRMELEARPATGAATANVSLPTTSRELHGSEPKVPPKVPAGQIPIYSATAASATTAAAPATGPDFKPFSQEGHGDMPAFDAPSFSPFPRVKGDNVPPSDEEKEEILYNARQHVLNSNNVSMQLVWARDSLTWVEIAAEAHMRENKDQPVRPATPRTEHELRTDAISIVEYLSSQGHPEALFMRSKWLEFGRFGFRPDKKEAYMGYKKAAEQGWGRAEYRMGMLFEGSNDMDKALQHYNQGLTMGDSAASYRLGMMHLMGQHGYPKDYQRGLELIQAAADTADEDAPQGAYVYGMLISRELPDISIPEQLLPLDLNLARQYIEKAAYLGFAKAQLNMGQAYELCQLGCDFNPALSLHYYGLAARQGQPEAALGVSRWFLFGYESVFPKNEQLAFRYAQQAADAKLATGEFAMGYYYEIGIHVQKDLREARVWYEKAADHGNKDAINRLSGLDQAKTLTKQDHETTALTRIKSKHGSQRGVRPERFSSRQQHDVGGSLPTLSEQMPGVPEDGYPPAAAAAAVPVAAAAVKAQDLPERGRTPAFSVNLEPSNLVMRPKSAAPYPVDENPVPLNVRPKSTAPYPHDDMADRQRLPQSAYYNPQIRQSTSGAPTDRPPSAFGIRPANIGSQGGPAARPIQISQSTGSLVPEQRAFMINSARPVSGEPLRGRVTSAGGWESDPRGQSAAVGPGGAAAGRGDYRAGYEAPFGYQQQPPQQPQPLQQQPIRQTLGSYPVGDPARNRLSKPNPNVNAAAQRLSQQPQDQGYGPGGGHGAGPGPAPVAQPGREYGPRISSRPGSSVYVAPNNGRSERVDSLPVPQLAGPGAGRQSASPMQVAGQAGGRPLPAAQSRVSPAPTTQGGPPSRPASAKPAQGPATFEAMGIPQGKNDDDCIIM